MSETAISIRPVGGGWMLSIDGVENTLMFNRGSSAETAARRLAERLGDVGQPVQIRLYLDDGDLAARLIYAADPVRPRLAWGGLGAAPRAA